MDFREAARILGEQVTTEDIADALGVSLYTIRQARLAPGAAGYRRPPANWRYALARLARGGARRVGELCARLDREYGRAPRGEHARVCPQNHREPVTLPVPVAGRRSGVISNSRASAETVDDESPASF